MSNSAADQPNRLIALPIDQWGVHDNQAVGMVIGSDDSGERFNLVAATEGKVGSAAFRNREDAETAVKIINDTLDSPATGRMGGPFVVFRKGKFKQGIRWVGYDLKVVDGEPTPDTDTPRAIVWLLPASDEKSVALVDTRDPENYRPVGFFLTTDDANVFMEAMDAIVGSISEPT
ncbi:MAG: hypothetical protein L0K41_10710 [Yaniella sp.]|uniref:hypothetical protein n=1 Tax=Yaniella sp. TaxID=2773929 RepID=UPI0026474603|nr:hypothetical protein [Yaniella sp.]MDN5731392.1 hypothetical protein [Yaniella sp.]MDN6490855.1 hypothetical protein [Yaniella sp.]